MIIMTGSISAPCARMLTMFPVLANMKKNEMHHIHDGCEILFVESGSADYFIDGKKYHISQGDVLVITAKNPSFSKDP